MIVERAQDKKTGPAYPLGSEKYRHIKRKVYCSIICCLDVAFAEYEPAIELSGIIRTGVIQCSVSAIVVARHDFYSITVTVWRTQAATNSNVYEDLL